VTIMSVPSCLFWIATRLERAGRWLWRRNSRLSVGANGRQVTAIDFSPAMIALLEERNRIEGIHNVKSHLARWEDDWAALGIEQHDVSIASRSLISDDRARC